MLSTHHLSSRSKYLHPSPHCSVSFTANIKIQEVSPSDRKVYNHKVLLEEQWGGAACYQLHNNNMDQWEKHTVVTFGKKDKKTNKWHMTDGKGFQKQLPVYICHSASPGKKMAHLIKGSGFKRFLHDKLSILWQVRAKMHTRSMTTNEGMNTIWHEKCLQGGGGGLLS